MIPTITRNTVRNLSVLFTAAILISFTNQAEPGEGTAEVNQLQGLYVFTDSKPVTPYDYLGTVNTASIVWKKRGYEETRETLLKKLKKEYPNADGVIFSFTDGKDKADAIKFK